MWPAEPAVSLWQIAVVAFPAPVVVMILIVIPVMIFVATIVVRAGRAAFASFVIDPLPSETKYTWVW